ncbi:MAG TPA: UDP-3-O-(3-hydroxymyristoyl)glucosamine N-acyltransferase [Chitinophagaceae bacterium]|nr:UDP-3-O-(3-hydroxymyristoyl)glucosamine N-acyltransferase [Chitinophagaceae bacterium]HNE92989.1 UDP-3-O-(3-hydroxymyristoyl)glucosamine N-acyltransferase [Chitinophagaceae bacterium]HNJ58074.1 UDP-3-O-(3-hydroxymyristoyl)glucosamine N-acyltransferase [Chitinophagaceae bacterium]HNL82828.1 UDP-3-O-(3-hydroxymyristoyl)glucosamine N-acyltransferase [Chitinophagaceae bacterium]HNM34269.1 UDP-3-O-(3-hydroxymyristoyl)glucosamine N-acyltransferase [Chitinophagaceae bacterium]
MLFPRLTHTTDIAKLIDAEVLGKVDAFAKGINEIHKVNEGDICFVDHPKYYSKCLNSAATFIIINTKDITIPAGKTIFFVKEPFEAYLKIVHHFRPFTSQQHAINDNVVIGKDTVIMPNVYIGNHVKIGNNCIIYPNVSILDFTEIGNNVVIQSGTVIGSNAFYYNTKKTREVWYKRMDSCGNVILEDFVEIGASCTIDRGVTASTIIGKGTKLDNMVHIGHDTCIGKNCLIAAQVGIAGATIVEDGVTLWGQVGVNKTITIGKNAVVLGQSGVTNSLEGDKVYFGLPAEDASLKRRELVWIKRIPELWKKVMG